MPDTITRPAGRLRPRNALPGHLRLVLADHLGPGDTSATLYECAKND